MTEPLLLMDADVFISAKNRYYAFDICPGFWDSLVYHFGAGNIRSIDKVRNELLVGRPTEDLYQMGEEPADTGLPRHFSNGCSQRLYGHHALGPAKPAVP